MTESLQNLIILRDKINQHLGTEVINILNNISISFYTFEKNFDELKQAIKRLESSDCQETDAVSSVNAPSQELRWGCPDLNRSHESPSLVA